MIRKFWLKNINIGIDSDIPISKSKYIQITNGIAFITPITVLRINSGHVVAGVIGLKKFVYDVWGDAVNTASRMESHGIPGKIQVSQFTYLYLKEGYIFEDRGSIEIKGKGKMQTYLLVGKKDP